MANPNRTVAEWRRKHPRIKTQAEIDAETQRRREMNPELYAIMDADSRGEMTPAEGAAALAKLQTR